MTTAKPTACAHCSGPLPKGRRSICSDECRVIIEAEQTRERRKRRATLLRCIWCDGHFVRYMNYRSAKAPAHRFRCPSCRSEPYDAAHARRGRGKRAQPAGRKYHLKQRYGMTHDQFDAMLVAQLNQCLICRRDLAGALLAVDHDHACCDGDRSCGACIRGILCRQCNCMLGFAKDSSETLRAAAQYLERSVVKA